MKIFWRKPVYIIKDRDHGMAPYSIVVYEKRVTFFRTEDRGPHPEGRILGIPVRWKHYLRIDLWIAVLDFTWVTGEQDI